MGQSSGDELQFGQNLSMQIRSDEIPFADDLPSEPERVLFGFSSASTDEILAVGAPHCDDRGSTRSGDFAGSVYIYMKDGEDWVPFPDIFGEPFPDGRDFKLYPSGLSAGDLFGWSVDIAKNTDGSHTLVVGAPGTRHAATGANDTGTVYVFDLPVNSYCWTQSPQSPLSLPSSFLSARAIPEEWEEAQPDAWLPPSELDLMAGIYSIPEERYGESVSLFSGELPKISGKDVTGIIAIGAPERDIYANVPIPDDPKKEDPPPNWQPVSEKAGASLPGTVLTVSGFSLTLSPEFALKPNLPNSHQIPRTR